jgi:hypothetical protein
MGVTIFYYYIEIRDDSGDIEKILAELRILRDYRTMPIDTGIPTYQVFINSISPCGRWYRIFGLDETNSLIFLLMGGKIIGPEFN